MTETTQPPTPAIDPNPPMTAKQKKGWLIVLAIAAVVAVVWGSLVLTTDTHQPSTSTGYTPSGDSGYTYTHTAVHNAPATGTALYHQYVQNDIPELAGASAASVDMLGRHVCTALSNAGVAAVAATFIGQGWNANHAATFVGYAVATFCPTEKALLTP